MKMKVCSILFLFLIGCAAKQESQLQPAPQPRPDPTPRKLTGAELKKLYESDLQSLLVADPAGLDRYDYLHKNRFKQIFSGYSGADLRRFFDERIKYSVTEDDNVDIIVSSDPVYTNWYVDPDPVKQKEDEEKYKEDQKKGVVVAFNWGSGLWLSSIIDRSEYTFILNGNSIPIDSSRVGIMGLGTGYREDARDYKVPASARHEVLLHEARHSDCTRGISQSDLDVIRNAKNPADYREKFQRRDCTHHHVMCPDSHSLGGLYACDNHPWGAYSISAIYTEARWRNFDLPIEEWSILNSISIEMKDRILIDYEKMISGEYGDPDMSHMELL